MISMNAVHNFGKREALVFTGALALETLVRSYVAERSEGSKNFKMFFLDAIKHVQFYAACATHPSYALSWVAKLKAHACLLPSNIIGVMFLSKITGIYHFKNSPLCYTELEVERPPLVSFVACLGEAAKIYAKTIGCLGTGRVVQKMWTGSSSGKVATAVSSVLFILSAWNIKNAVAHQK
ncbi:MAG: hypothetical protein KBA81_02925 [Rhabdochlamydiaceae bacterium]|nr:hypothetical protein [Rhabdochlamydiaceae bacterium]